MSDINQFEDLKVDHLYKIKNSEEYFVIHSDKSGNFYWKNKDGDKTIITNSPIEPSSIDVDEEQSFVGVHYFATKGSPFGDIPVINMKKYIDKGRYTHIGPLDKNKDLIM